MLPVFGRVPPAPHEYEIALAEWLVSSIPEDRAMARNIMYDQRVSEAREHVFHLFGGEPQTARDLYNAIKAYRTKKIQPSKRPNDLPDFLNEELNSENLLDRVSTLGHQQIRKDVSLVRVLDLNGLAIPVLQWAAQQKRWREFERFPYRKPKHIGAWLNEKLEFAGHTEEDKSRLRTPFIEVMLEVMNAYRQVASYQPTWTISWESFKPCIPEGPERWLELTGVCRDDFPHWLILLRYTVGEAGTLVRPTQLDAGWLPQHFPSPPSADGHPMDLRISPLPSVLSPEYIHEQIDHDIMHWDDAGRRCAMTQRDVRGSLGDQRRAHHKLLARIYGKSQICYWMPACSNQCQYHCNLG